MNPLYGPQHPLWKGGRTVTRDGYVRITAGPNRHKYEHRVMWEQAYGPIPTGKDVHHQNEIRTDNRLENFELRDARPHRMEALAKHNKRSKLRKRKDLTRNEHVSYPTGKTRNQFG